MGSEMCIRDRSLAVPPPVPAELSSVLYEAMRLRLKQPPHGPTGAASEPDDGDDDVAQLGASAIDRERTFDLLAASLVAEANARARGLGSGGTDEMMRANAPASAAAAARGVAHGAAPKPAHRPIRSVAALSRSSRAQLVQADIEAAAAAEDEATINALLNAQQEARAPSPATDASALDAEEEVAAGTQADIFGPLEHEAEAMRRFIATSTVRMAVRAAHAVPCARVHDARSARGGRAGCSGQTRRSPFTVSARVRPCPCVVFHAARGRGVVQDAGPARRSCARRRSPVTDAHAGDSHGRGALDQRGERARVRAAG